MGDNDQRSVAPKYGTAGKVLGFLSWAQIALPIAFVLFTLPGSLYLVAFAAPIIGLPIGLGILGVGISKALPLRHRVMPAFIWSFVHLAAFTGLALHSQTWDPSAPGDEKFFLVLRVVFWFAVALNLSILIILALPSRPSAKMPQDFDLYPGIKPPLWPWLAAAAVILALSAIGIAAAVRT